MDWKVFLTSFGVLFLAELGDKTQLAIITLTSQTGNPLGVFWGALSALALVTVLGVVFGHLIHQWISPEILRKLAACVFIAIGLVMFFGKF
jgi:putative Ca2+/H+ antiporter (TMEM165/GDT1 family)